MLLIIVKNQKLNLLLIIINLMKRSIISSLENLVRVNDTYDVILLDEVNSLINHFYTNTLKSIRLRCVGELLNIVEHIKKTGKHQKHFL